MRLVAIVMCNFGCNHSFTICWSEVQVLGITRNCEEAWEGVEAKRQLQVEHYDTQSGPCCLPHHDEPGLTYERITLRRWCIGWRNGSLKSSNPLGITSLEQRNACEEAIIDSCIYTLLNLQQSSSSSKANTVYLLPPPQFPTGYVPDLTGYEPDFNFLLCSAPPQSRLSPYLPRSAQNTRSRKTRKETSKTFSSIENSVWGELVAHPQAVASVRRTSDEHYLLLRHYRASQQNGWNHDVERTARRKASQAELSRHNKPFQFWRNRARLQAKRPALVLAYWLEKPTSLLRKYPTTVPDRHPVDPDQFFSSAIENLFSSLHQWELDAATGPNTYCLRNDMQLFLQRSALTPPPRVSAESYLANYGADINDRKSATGYIYYCFLHA